MRNQQAGKLHCPGVTASLQEGHWNRANVLTGDGMKESRFTIPKTLSDCKKWEIWLSCVSKLLILRQKWVAGVRQGNSLVVLRVSPGRKVVELFWTKCAVSGQIKPGILNLTIRRGQSNFSIVFVFVSCEGKGCYCFGSTAQFWLPLVLRARPTCARMTFSQKIWKFRLRPNGKVIF